LNHLGIEVSYFKNLEEGLSNLRQMDFLNIPFPLVIYSVTLFNGKVMDQLEQLVNETSTNTTAVFCCTWEELFDKLISDDREYPVTLLGQPVTLKLLADQIERRLIQMKRRRI
jgi:hypothetical protein